MSDTKKVEEAKVAKVVLAPGSESGDPAVHQLLAQKQTAVLNGDKEQLKALDEQLAALGFK